MPLFKPKYWIYFTRSQRRGVIVLLFLIILIQLLYFVCSTIYIEKEQSLFVIDEEANKQLDSMYTIFLTNKEKNIYPYNPNFITDYKGFSIGMSTGEIDRLHQFRAQNLYVNSAKEFQAVTKVSDEWLAQHADNFKFTKREFNRNKQFTSNIRVNNESVIEVKDINIATQDDLIAIRGIGPAFSDRIIKERDKFGGFVAIEQLDFIWGIPPETIEELKKHFEIKGTPIINKININEASIDEIKVLPYMNYYIAREIVKLRSIKGNFSDKADFEEIINFPFDKIDIIDLYLNFEN